MTTKEKILDALLELASENGIHKTSMSMISAKVGIQKASLYHYYSSKDEMVKDLYHSFRDTPNNVKPIDESLSLEEVITQSFDNYIKMCSNGKMEKVFKIIETEKFVSKIARDLYIEETNRMLNHSVTFFTYLNNKFDLKLSNISEISEIYCLYAHEMVLMNLFEDKEFTNEKCHQKINQFIKLLLLKGEN